MRAFIAIKLPLDIKNALAKIQDESKTALPKINWVKPPNLHLSLKFLGGIFLKQLEAAKQIVAAVAKTTHPFEIKLEALDVFPNYRKARIIWIGTNQPPIQLTQLVAQLEKRFLDLGIPQEQRAFQAHITLGRIKHSITPLADLENQLNKLKNKITNMHLKFDPRGITLFQSVLDPGGPTYRILNESSFFSGQMLINEF
jgi:2'-5' RNA ligase